MMLLMGRVAVAKTGLVALSIPGHWYSNMGVFFDIRRCHLDGFPFRTTTENPFCGGCFKKAMLQSIFGTGITCVRMRHCICFLII